MELEVIALTAIFILAVGLISGRIEHSFVTAPMLFVIFGYVLSDAGFGIISLELENESLILLAEVTLVLVLFTDASRIDLNLLRREHDLPERLLSVGLLLVIVAGTGIAVLLFEGITIWHAAIMATILAPTDAALAQAVLHLNIVPVRIRQTLNVESGLNDGIALPLLILFLTLETAVEGGESLSQWFVFAAGQLILGPLTGLVIGYVGSKLLLYSEQRGWLADAFERLSSLGLALLAYAMAEIIGGNGFIAAFVAGLVVGNTARQLRNVLQNFAEAEGLLLTLLTFIMFGALMVPMGLADLTIEVVVYALLSLTVVRILPVALSLFDKSLRWETVLFLGWFGPRGIASIIYVLVVIHDGHIHAHESSLLLSVTATTILFSIFLHGISASPLSHWYEKRLATFRRNMIHEHRDVAEMPVSRW